MDNFYLINLYDVYGSILTEKQQIYFEDYYFDNLSLKEISDNYNVSRNAVYNSLKETENKLKNYEEKLKIYERNNQIEKIIEKIEDEKIIKELRRVIL